MYVMINNKLQYQKGSSTIQLLWLARLQTSRPSELSDSQKKKKKHGRSGKKAKLIETKPPP